MPEYKHTGTDHRTFPDLGLEVDPGEVVELDSNPDPAFFAEIEDKPAPKRPTKER